MRARPRSGHGPRHRPPRAARARGRAAALGPRRSAVDTSQRRRRCKPPHGTANAHPWSQCAAVRWAGSLPRRVTGRGQRGSAAAARR